MLRVFFCSTCKLIFRWTWSLSVHHGLERNLSQARFSWPLDLHGWLVLQDNSYRRSKLKVRSIIFCNQKEHKRAVIYKTIHLQAFPSQMWSLMFYMFYSTGYWIGLTASNGEANWNDGTSYNVTSNSDTAPGTSCRLASRSTTTPDQQNSIPRSPLIFWSQPTFDHMAYTCLCI